MSHEMKGSIHHLDEEEAKSLLYQVFLRMQVVEERKGYSEQQFYLDLKNTYNDLLEYVKKQVRDKQTQYHTTHLVFGDSPYGSLNIALQKLGRDQEETIINFSDLYSIGPLWKLHDVKGIVARDEWLRNHINMEDEVNYEDDCKGTILEVEQIPSHHPIIIWIGENAHEQTGLRLALYLLREKSNDIFMININETYKTHFDNPEIDFTPLHMGELSSDQLIHIYENAKNDRALTRSERKTFEHEWEILSNEKDLLRIWESNQIMSVPKNFYDEYIIDTVQKFHQKNKSNEFIKSARIIGEVMGHLDQYVGDSFLEYRVRRLIVDGIFDIEGVPKAMRYYSIKMR